MKTYLGSIAISVVTSVLLSGVVAAQEPEQVVVQAKRMFTSKNVGRTPSGIPIVDVSLSYGVRASDIDLATVAGAHELERRVKEAAESACSELGRRYPHATPSNLECAQQATSQAMVQVNRLIASAASSSRR